jgi:hypothetical protein
VPGLTPDSIQKKYAQTVVSTSIAPGCVQFLGEENRFHTAWVTSGRGSEARVQAPAGLRPPRLVTFDGVTGAA